MLKLAREAGEKRVQIVRKPGPGEPPASDLLFAMPIGTKLSAFSVIKAGLDAAIAAGWPRRWGEGEQVELPGWMFHDFRRAGVTALAEAGFPPHACDRLLNHVTGASQGVAVVYQRAEFWRSGGRR